MYMSGIRGQGCPCSNAGRAIGYLLIHISILYKVASLNPLLGDTAHDPADSSDCEYELTSNNLYRFVFRDCEDAYDSGWTTSGIYRLSPTGSTESEMDVYCDQDLDGGGWIVFQRRTDGSEDFFRSWSQYKHGFGNLTHEFWLGNDKIHTLTSQKNCMLKVEMAKDHGGTKYFANYNSFSISNEENGYKLSLSGFQQAYPPGDSLIYANGVKFSTWDQDNDLQISSSCACRYRGAWWYKRCHQSNLNGMYGSTTYGKGLNWLTLTAFSDSLAETRLLLKKSTLIGPNKL